MALKKSQHVKVEHPNSDSDYSNSEHEIDDLESNTEELADSGEDVTSTQKDGSSKSGLADVMSKILQKKIPKHKQTILAKGKTDREIRKRKLEAEEDEEEKDKKAKQAEVHLASHEKKRLWEDMCRIKPNPLDRDKERKLQRIGTRGVVQLFNAVRKQQKVIGDELDGVGSSVRRQDKVLEGVTKEKFLSILKGSNITTEPVADSSRSKSKAKKKMKESDDEEDEEEEEGEDKKKWSILRDDFMMGAKMKDWNKESSDEDEEEEDVDDGPDMSDSD